MSHNMSHTMSVYYKDVLQGCIEHQDSPLLPTLVAVASSLFQVAVGFIATGRGEVLVETRTVLGDFYQF